MKITAKLARASYAGRAWTLTIDGKPLAELVRCANSELCLSWCDVDFNAPTIKLLKTTTCTEFLAIAKAINYTI